MNWFGKFIYINMLATHSLSIEYKNGTLFEIYEDIYGNIGGIIMFEKIKRFYDLGLYTAEQVHKFAEKGVITEKEYAEIKKEKEEI